MQDQSTLGQRALGIGCLALCAVGALALARGAGRSNATGAVDPVGVWTVVDYTATDPANGAVTHPFGAALLGAAIYTRGGHLSVLVAGHERGAEPGSGAGTRKGSSAAASSTASRNALRAQWLDSMYAYDGTYTLTGDTLTVHIESAWQPSWVGSTKTRTLSLKGDVLTVSTPPMVSPVDGRTYISVTRFRRAE